MFQAMNAPATPKSIHVSDNRCLNLPTPHVKPSLSKRGRSRKHSKVEAGQAHQWSKVNQTENSSAVIGAGRKEGYRNKTIGWAAEGGQFERRQKEGCSGVDRRLRVGGGSKKKLMDGRSTSFFSQSLGCGGLGVVDQ